MQMHKPYRGTAVIACVNRVMRPLIDLGIAPPGTYTLTAKGRKSGQPRSTPVTLVEEGAERWLVAPYGDVNWVRNARAAGEVTLGRRGTLETVSVTELGPAESAPVLKKYLKVARITQPYFDARPGSPVGDFEAEAGRHPVFRIEGK
jgi:deazaflavin-dependent oxidoreductase (nitroreductase family)